MILRIFALVALDLFLWPDDHSNKIGQTVVIIGCRSGIFPGTAFCVYIHCGESGIALHILGS
jgi:hypothetical protein